MGVAISGGLRESGWSLKFAGDDLAVIFRNNGFQKRLVVTFDELSAFNHSRDAVSGDRLAMRCEADHLHLATNRTAWYQTREIFDVIPIMQGICAAYEEVLLFGHSMGGYAALLLSGPLKATNVVAFAPQFSVDPDQVPFENRFDGFVKNLEFVFDDMLDSASKTAPLNIVFDPYTHHDNEHFKLMSGLPNIRPLRLPFAGHFPGEFLKDSGCLSRTTIDLLLMTADRNEIRQSVRRGRRRSYRYFLERATLAGRRRNPREAFRLASIAYALRPDSPSVLETFHALLMHDNIFYGVSHAMVRLVQHEQPTWTHYDGTRENLFKEIRKIAEPTINSDQAVSKPVELELFDD